MKNLFNQRKKDFRDLLDNHRGQISPKTRWEDVISFLRDDSRYELFPERSRRQAFEQHKEYLGKLVQKEFYLMMNAVDTKQIIRKYATKPYESVEQELIEELEEKDDRFVKMGECFFEERHVALKEEFML